MEDYFYEHDILRELCLEEIERIVFPILDKGFNVTKLYLTDNQIVLLTGKSWSTIKERKLRPYYLNIPIYRRENVQRRE